MIRSVIYILVLVLLITGISLITILPWWTFTIPCFLIGIWHSHKKINGYPFSSGFLAGFIVWAGSTVFFHKYFGGNVINTLSGLLNNISPVLVILLIGAIGGLMTGLAVFTGSMLFKKEEMYKLNLAAEHTM